MNVSELAAHPELVPSTITEPFQRSLRGGFITIRLRGSPALRGTSNVSQVADTKVQQAIGQLKTELNSADARATWIAQKMDEYATAGKLLSLQNLDPLLLKAYFPGKLLQGTESIDVAKRRVTMVAAISWWATASHPQLLDLQRRPDLLKLVDRRLRVCERMLYHVAENLHGTSNLPDGTNRIFEYPGANAPPSLSAEAAAAWNGPLGSQNYRFARKPGKSGTEAVEALFLPHATRDNRNRLFCDQVIQALHIEGFMASEKNERGDHSWFNAQVAANSPQWLRIDSPWGKDAAFLASEGDTTYFEHVSVGIADLQLGDHLIVYNHPVFHALLPDSEWQLENSIVVQVHPKPLVQGHGMLPMTLADMKGRLLDRCNDELLKARDKVEADNKVVTPTENAADLFPSIELSSTCRAVRRVPPSQSEFEGVSRKADWWLRWVPLSGREGEDDLYSNTDPARATYWNGRRAHAKQTQLVDIVVRNTFQHPYRNGFFFPLWEPDWIKVGANVVARKNPQGKISLIFPTAVDEPMASLANWYYPSDFHRGTTTVIRPRVS